MHVDDLLRVDSANWNSRRPANRMKGAANARKRRKRFSRPYTTMLRGTGDLRKQVNFWHARWRAGKMKGPLNVRALGRGESWLLLLQLGFCCCYLYCNCCCYGAEGRGWPWRMGTVDWLGVLPLWQQGLSKAAGQGTRHRRRLVWNIGGPRLGDPISRKFLKVHTWNRAIWWIVQAKIHLFPVADHGICRRWVRTSFRSQPNSSIYVFESVVNSPVGSGAKPLLSTILVHF